MEMCQSTDNDGKERLSISGRNASLRLGLYKCPSCGTEVEIFSDEYQVKCYQCGKIICREKLSPCIEWCTSISECIRERRRKE